MNFQAEYHIRKNYWDTDFIKVLAPTLIQACIQIFKLDPSLKSVESQILGGGKWISISRETLDNQLQV